MLQIRSESGVIIGRIELSGKSVGPAENRAVLEWARACPVPNGVILTLGGGRRDPTRLFAANLGNFVSYDGSNVTSSTKFVERKIND